MTARIAPGIVEILEGVKALIDAPEKWCQKTSRSRDGQRRCLMGALEDVLSGIGDHGGYFAAYDAIRAETKIAPAAFNDKRTHTDVMAALDGAIASARAAQDTGTR